MKRNRPCQKLYHWNKQELYGCLTSCLFCQAQYLQCNYALFNLFSDLGARSMPSAPAGAVWPEVGVLPQLGTGEGSTWTALCFGASPFHKGYLETRDLGRQGLRAHHLWGEFGGVRLLQSGRKKSKGRYCNSLQFLEQLQRWCQTLLGSTRWCSNKK